MAVGSYDPIASNNTTINGVALGENVMVPSDVNNALRELMADLAILKGTEVANTPAGDIVATEVQAAINELDTDKVSGARLLTAGDGLVGGGDLSADRTFDLDLATLPAGTVATADELAMADVDDSNNVKKISAQSIANLNRTLDLIIDNAEPGLSLDESDGTAGFSVTKLVQNADIFRIETRTDAQVLVASDYEIEKDASGALQHTWSIGADDRLRIDGSGRLIIGDVDADPLPSQAGGVLISTGNSGVTDANNNSDGLIIENDSNAGISILSPNTSQGIIAFADPEDDNVGRLIYDHNANNFQLFTAGLLGVVVDRTAAGDTSVLGTLSTGRIRLNITSDASLASTAHALQTGATTGLNIIQDNNEIMARNNGAAAVLLLNSGSGDVQVLSQSILRRVNNVASNDGYLKVAWGGTGGETAQDLLIQWGHVAIGVSGTTITFPVAFSGTPWGFGSTSEDLSGSQNDLRTNGYDSLTASNVLVRNWRPTGNPVTIAGNIRYIVIGPTT